MVYYMKVKIFLNSQSQFSQVSFLRTTASVVAMSCSIVIKILTFILHSC